jgi:hypothetical protein
MKYIIAGYYWVKYSGSWTVMQYGGENANGSIWAFPGGNACLHDFQIEMVFSEQILPPVIIF